MRKLLVVLVVVGTSGCPDVDVDSNETTALVPGPTVEFEPSKSIIPFPNNLLLCPASGTSLTGFSCTPGRVFIPPTACETPAQTALRVNVLNTLNGFGTYEAAIQVTFTEPVDPATLAGNVLLFQTARARVPLDPTTAVPIPVKVVPTTTLRFTEGMCSTPATVDAIAVIPAVPLDENSTYVVVVTNGVKTAGDFDFLPSFTWALVNQASPPVVLDANGNVIINRTPLNPFGGADANHNGIPDLLELQGLAALWAAEAPALAFVTASGQVDRASILVATEFTTQTTTDPLDPAVPGSTAAMLSTSPLLGVSSVVPGGGGNSAAYIRQVLQLIGAASSPAEAAAICANIHCDSIGNVLGGALGVQNYLRHVANPLPGGADLHDAWTDPYTPTEQPPFTVPPAPAGTIPVLAFVPAGTPPAGGWPVVVFGHGLGSAKEALFLFAPQLANAGFASIAIDLVDHGSRAIRISTDPALGCANVGHCSTSGTTCDPTAPGGATCPTAQTCVGYSSFASAPQCYESFLTVDLAEDRDSFRQTALDLERLILAVKACDTTSCGPFEVDPAHITYVGQSLGGILGTMTVAVAPDPRSSILNVSGVGWVDILENTQTLQIRCSLVDALIDIGVLVGDKWNGSTTNPTGLCATTAFKAQPGYQQFAVFARWVLDPAEPANFMAKLAPRTFLLQEVMGDTVIPNFTTDNQGALAGLTPAGADIFIPVCAGGTNAGGPCSVDAQCPASKCLADPSAAILDPGQWLRYMNLPPDPAIGFPGNTFAHGSLLRPADSTTAGALGTARMQTDAITFLVLNH